MNWLIDDPMLDLIFVLIAAMAIAEFAPMLMSKLPNPKRPRGRK